MEEKENETKKDTIKKKEVEKKPIKKEESKENVKEVIVEKNAGFNYAEVILIMIISLVLGIVIGYFINYFAKDNKTKTVITTNSSSEIPAELNEFLETYEGILNDYYEDVDPTELLEAGIDGMLNYLGDDYSSYMNQEQTEAFNEQVEGKYKGIGVEITLKEEGVQITKVFANSPAEQAGLKVGDIFVSIDGNDVSSENALTISNLIRSSESGKVEVVVSRDKEKKKFELNLAVVDIESVNTKVFDENGKKIGYIELTLFASNSYDQFKAKLEKLEKENIDSLIIDVRANSGGYLSVVTDIASLFLGKGKVIYQLDTKGVVEQIYSNSKASRKYDIVVLIDGGSASASEILAAALQESYGAVVIGTNSYGKGTVQAAYQLESGATIKYTIQKWLTPNGNWINEVGITPDIEVELDESYLENLSDESDNQLQRAIQELSK